MAHVGSRIARFASLAFAVSVTATAGVHILFLGSGESREFSDVRAAAVAANSSSSTSVSVSALYQRDTADVGTQLATLPPEKIAALARSEWPGDETFVITANAAKAAGLPGLISAFEAVVQTDRDQRRAVLRRGRGLLSGFARAGAPHHMVPPPYLAGISAAAAQNVVFAVDSDECATFARNGVMFDKPCGFGPGRGINIVVVNQFTGEIETIYTFDTWIALAQSAQYLVQYIPQILPERLVLIANADANDLHELPTAVAAMQQRFGGACVSQVDFRDSWTGASQNMKMLLEQCNSYSAQGNYVDSSIQYSLPAAQSNDVNPPSGIFRINAGAPVTSSNLVTLDFSGVTDSGSGLNPGGKIRLSNDGKTWSPMLEFAATQNWPLDRNNGKKTVYAQVRDRAGNWADTLTASITLQEQTPLRGGPAGSSFYYAPQFCFAGGNIVALSDSGDVSISTDLGSDWSKPRSVLPSQSDFGWGALSLTCDGSGNILATAYSLDMGSLRVETNSSSDGGGTWRPSPKPNVISVPSSDYYYPQSVCSSSPSNVVLFWVATIGSTDQLFAIGSHDGGLTWPTTPVQLVTPGAGSYIDGLQTACSGSTAVAAVGASENVIVYRSVNGGGGFSAGAQAASGAYNFSLAADPNGELLLLTLVYGPNSNSYSLIGRNSRDGGATWTLPATVASDVASYYSFRAFPAGVGQFYVAWISQLSTDGSEGIKLTSTKDGGATWAAPTSVTNGGYFYSFMLAEKPSITDFALAANASGGVELLWADNRQGLGYGYGVQRRGVAAAARGPHEDQDIQPITDIYIATSADSGRNWKVSGPAESDAATGEGYVDGLIAWLGPDGTGIGVWGSENMYLDVRFLNGATVPLVDPGGPVSDASQLTGALAPGELADITGQNLASASVFGQAPGLPSALAGTSVSVTDASGSASVASLYGVNGNQIRFVVPDSLMAGPAQMKVSTSRGSVNIPIAIVPTAPGLFSVTGDGTGYPSGWLVQTYADGTSQVVSLSATTSVAITPNTASLQLTLLGTGIRHAASVKILVGGAPLDNVSFSANSDWPGLDQIAGFVPGSLAGAGTVPVYVVANGIASNSLNLTFK